MSFFYWILRDYIGQAVRIQIIAAHEISAKVRNGIISLKNYYPTDHKVSRVLHVASWVETVVFLIAENRQTRDFRR